MLTVHASSLSRIMECAGSVALEKPLPSKKNDAALEGDAAHWCSAYALESGEPGKPGKKAPNGWVTDKEMWRHAERFADAMLSRPNADGNGKIENAAHWFASSEIEVRCKIDWQHYDKENDTLYIDDYKYGWRVVEPESNWQLVAYAIGVCRNLSIAPARIVLSIFQPRAFHIDGAHRSWVIDSTALSEHYGQIFTRLTNLTQELKTGPHCNYCLAAPRHCPAIRAAGFNSVDVIMNELDYSMDFSCEDHSRELDTLERAAEIVKQRIGWLEDLAENRIRNGEIIPGRYLKKSYGKTEWNSIKAAREIQKSSGVKLFESKPVTPAEAKRRGVDEDVVKAHTNRPERGMKLAKGSGAKEAEKVFT